jgi:Fe-S-cluster containining protein
MAEVPAIDPNQDFGSPANREVVLDSSVHYVCQRCGACCRWPGDVRLEPGELALIARFLGLLEEDFIQRYTRLRSNRQGLSLVEKPDHECIMLEDGACRIHPVKPAQCDGFPNKWNFQGWRQFCASNGVALCLRPSPLCSGSEAP